jgi:hypothetical protein
MSIFVSIEPSSRILDKALIKDFSSLEENFISTVKSELSNNRTAHFCIESLLKDPQLGFQAKTHALSLAILGNRTSLIQTIYIYGKLTAPPSLAVVLEAKENGCKASLGYLYTQGFVSYNDYLEAKEVEESLGGARVLQYTSPVTVLSDNSTAKYLRV